MAHFRITIVVPCWKRPLRTRRMLENIMAQDMTEWEAFFIGDGCADFEEMMNSYEVKEIRERASSQGSLLHLFNWHEHVGGWGQHILNYAIDNAKAQFFIFAANDDEILSNHFRHYLSEIEDSPMDMVAYKTFVAPNNSMRAPQFRACEIGHSEIILRTCILKGLPKVPASGTHDWSLIDEMMRASEKYKQALSQSWTYKVNQLLGQSENPRNVDIID
jgi:hypothetical protein